MLGAGALGTLSFVLQERPEAQVQLFGNAVFGLIYASPFLLALVVSRVLDPSKRSTLLLWLGLLSLLAGFSSFSGVTVILVPAAAAILLASVQSRGGQHSWGQARAPITLSGMLGVLLIAVSFFAIFEFDDDEARCWALAQTEDGGYSWTPTEVVGGPDNVSILTAEEGIKRSFCVSDIITNSEAALSLVILAIGAAIVLVVSWSGQATGEQRPTRDG